MTADAMVTTGQWNVEHSCHGDPLMSLSEDNGPGSKDGAESWSEAAVGGHCLLRDTQSGQKGRVRWCFRETCSKSLHVVRLIHP